MGKIDRYSGNMKAFAAEALSTERTIFGDTAQSDTLDDNITTAFLRGWEIVGVNENPTKQDFNGLAFTLGQLISYLHQRGIAEWNAAQEYYEGSVVTTLVGIYRLTSGGVGSSDPDTDDGDNWDRVGISDVDWELIPTQAEVDAKADQDTTYTETEVDGLLDTKADQATTYTETEVNNLLNAKADQDTTYTKTAVDGLLDDLSGLGVGQTWHDVTTSRAKDVTYTNSSGKAIFISVTDTDGEGSTIGFTLFVDGSIIAKTLSYIGSVSGYPRSNLTAIIPNGSTYKVVLHALDTIHLWSELR